MILMMSKYRVFCTVVELGSFTQAANKLNYSQSAVSQTIKALEQELGTTLVSRQTHRLQLTRDGECYLLFLPRHVVLCIQLLLIALCGALM